MKMTHINIVPQENIWERALQRYVLKKKMAFKNRLWKHVTYIIGVGGRTSKWLFQLEYEQRLESEKLQKDFRECSVV